MRVRLICKLLGLPPTINFADLKSFDDTPPEVVIHKKNIPAGIISLMIAVAIFLFMTQSQILQNTYYACTNLLNNLADFMSEAPLIEMLIRGIGFGLNILLFWVIPLTTCLIAAIRSVLEFIPRLKNPRDLRAIE